MCPPSLVVGDNHKNQQHFPSSQHHHPLGCHSLPQPPRYKLPKCSSIKSPPCSGGTQSRVPTCLGTVPHTVDTSLIPMMSPSPPLRSPVCFSYYTDHIRSTCPLQWILSISGTLARLCKSPASSSKMSNSRRGHLWMTKAETSGQDIWGGFTAWICTEAREKHPWKKSQKPILRLGTPHSVHCLPDQSGGKGVQLPLATTSCPAVNKTDGISGSRLAIWSGEMDVPTPQSCPHPFSATHIFFK